MRAEPSPADPVLQRLPAATWRSSPALVVAGVVPLLAYVLAGWVLGPAAPAAWVLVGLLSAPAVLWAVDRLHGELFDLEDTRPGLTRRLVVVGVFISIPCLLAAWSTFAAAVAASSGSVFFQVLAVAGTALTVVSVLIAVVAVPIGTVRADVTVRTIALASFLAGARRPLGPIAAVATAAAVAWLGFTWFGGLLVFVVPVLVVFAIGGAWPTATAFGISLPPLAPTRSAAARARPGEA
ncbi:small-conductance mechanosensitive channel [Agromyces cerinus]|uniref:hypothetical protein n=1 Tax=Agromyces cerinus TaxID=33878 RepID=UPI00195AFFB9|nr:hypothetical protein [Agromyces cerinus]MBM7832142.1 small-conductance mechanosensitive channel [Agromyces cerinus]